MADLENKRIFLVATPSLELNSQLEDVIKNHVSNTTVFTAMDGIEALRKSENVPPHVVVVDHQIQKLSAYELTKKLLLRKDRVAVIILSPEGEEQAFIDEMVTGQVQFLSGTGKVSVFNSHVTRALNWVSHEDKSIYHLRFLSPEEHLIKEGDKADFVYILKNGELKAYKQDGENEIVLGNIFPGEFVGEMAYINGEARSANVISVTDCELIEIPAESLDAVLFSKPAWSKALLKTLSKRLKNSNEEKAVKVD
ncbi:Crp/Fnr family transcriptional regulator [Bdellovibrio sp. HCB337]|uniref:Crp/Fnr family transcriptional regulator n=1 Tax=Bdellovibrio sp. HCB337 TaxID=3394358 RepID=UPI0039A6C755